MIKACCRTNLDDYQRQNWPQEFCFPPREGDLVESEDGQILKVVKITHVIRTNYDDPPRKYPMILVELHKTVGG